MTPAPESSTDCHPPQYHHCRCCLAYEQKNDGALRKVVHSLSLIQGRCASAIGSMHTACVRTITAICRQGGASMSANACHIYTCVKVCVCVQVCLLGEADTIFCYGPASTKRCAYTLLKAQVYLLPVEKHPCSRVLSQYGDSNDDDS